MTDILDIPLAAPATVRAPLRRAAASAGPAIVAVREFLTFCLGAEEYGLDILRVQEIRSYEAPTRLANAPAFVKGVVNLRGVIIPIVDLRMALGCADVVYDDFTVIIILNVQGRVVGAVVDSVSDVIELRGDEIRPAPPMGDSMDTSYLTGIGTIADAGAGERLLILVDIESLLRNSALGLVELED